MQTSTDIPSQEHRLKSMYPWVLVALLWVVAMLNYLDRQMLATMKPSMQGDIEELQLAANFGRLMAVFLWVYGMMSPLYNEPGNSDQYEKSFGLLKAVFGWARQVNPSQPISVGLWNNGSRFKAMNQFMIKNSDVITYHNYSYIDDHKNAIDTLRKFGRPLICTEYMARRNGSLFQVVMPLLKKENVGAINWGFVSGKTNTIFAWDTPIKDSQEPGLWFHDIYRQDKSPFSKNEVEFIKKITSGK